MSIPRRIFTLSSACGLPAFKRRRNVEISRSFICSPKRNLAIGNFLQSGSQPFRITSQKRAGSVGQKFSLARYGQLDKRSRDRRKNGQKNSDKHHYKLRLSATFSVISSAPEKLRSYKKIRHKRHKADKDYDNGGNQNIFVANMRQLMGNNSFQFVLVKNFPQPGSYRDSRVFLIPAGGESVGRRVVYHIKFWHFEPCRNTKIFHNSVKL